MYSFNDLTERECRKLSTTTASTCLDPWPHKHSLTPSVESAPYPSRFVPTHAADDIKYQPIYKKGNAGQNRISPKTLQLDINVEHLNGNTQSMDCDDCAFHKESEPILVEEASANTVQKNQMHNDFKRNGSLDTVAVEATEKQQDCSQSYESSEKIFENPETNDTSYIQKPPQQNIDEELNHNEAIMSKSQQKPHPTKPDSRESFTGGVTVGIGGQAINSADSTGHVRKIEVNGNERNASNITGRSEDVKNNIGTKL